MKKVVSILLTLVLALGICIIPIDNTQVFAATKKRTITKYKSCGIGDTVKLMLKSTNGKSKWKSSNSKVVSVVSATKSYCKVKAKKPGTATITTTYKNVTYKWKITVDDARFVEDQLINAKIEYLSSFDDEALWFHSTYRKANYNGGMSSNGKPNIYGTFTTIGEPTQGLLKLTVWADYDLGEYNKEYIAEESTGKYYFYNRYDKYGNIIIAARYSKEHKSLIMAYYDEDDNGGYYVVFTFSDGKYDNIYRIYRGNTLKRNVDTQFGIPFDFSKEDNDTNGLHTFDSLSRFGTIYEDVDYLLNKPYVWKLND